MICPSCSRENIEGSDRCENCLSSFQNLDTHGPGAAGGLEHQVMEDKLSQLETEATIIAAPDAPAIEVAIRMKELNTGCALVLDGPKLVGIFTEHDVLTRLSAHAKSGRARPDEGRSNSVFEEQDEPAPAIPVEEIRFNGVPSSDIPLEEIRVDETPAEVTPAELNGKKYKAYQDAAAPLRSALQVPVSELMSRNPEMLHEHESVAFALNKMSIGRFRHIPVKKADGTYTVVSIKTVLKYIAREDW